MCFDAKCSSAFDLRKIFDLKKFFAVPKKIWKKNNDLFFGAKICLKKGVFSKPSGNLILGPDFCVLR